MFYILLVLFSLKNPKAAVKDFSLTLLSKLLTRHERAGKNWLPTSLLLGGTIIQPLGTSRALLSVPLRRREC